jgi:hypothetical protein
MAWLSICKFLSKWHRKWFVFGGNCRPFSN